MPTWIAQRTHRYYTEVDLVFFELHGDFILADIQCLYAMVDPIKIECGYALTGFDARDSGTLTAEARKYIGAKNRADGGEGATVIVGASVAARTIIGLLRNAARLFGKDATPLLFCATTAEAQQWLAGQRARCRAARTAGSR